MPTQIYFSSRVECLANDCSEHIRQLQRSPLEPITIITPNANVDAWLKEAITLKNGSAINLNMARLENGLVDFIQQHWPNTRNLSSLTKNVLSLNILNELLHRCQVGPFSAVEKYILGEKREHGNQLVSRRLWQTSLELARLFLEYEGQRQEMIDKWLSSKKVDHHHALEQIQQQIYTGLFGQNGALSEDVTSFASLRRFYSLCLKHPPDLASHGKPLLIFAPTHISTFYYSLFYRLSEFFDLRLYLFNLCQEFWADMVSTRDEARQNRKFKHVRSMMTKLSVSDEEIRLEEWENDQYENDLLKLWGNPGREMVALLSDFENRSLPTQNIEERWIGIHEEPFSQPNTMLEAVQHCIVHRTNHIQNKVPLDTSLQFFSAPTPRREVDTVVLDIIEQMRCHPELLASDFTILAPNIGTYESHLKASLASHSLYDHNKSLPWEMKLAKKQQSGCFTKALLNILHLSQSSYERTKVSEIISNPLVMQSLEITQENLVGWLKCCEELSIHHHLDGKHREQDGLEGHDAYTWRSAFQNIQLRKIYDTQQMVRNITSSSQLIVFPEWNEPGEEIEKIFCAIEILFRKLELIRDCRWTAQQWQEFITSIIDDYLKVPEDWSIENSEFEKCRTFLNELTLVSEQCPNRELKLDTHLMMQILEDRLSSRFEQSGNCSSGGVLLSSLRDARPIPRKYVYLIGMQEGQFPGVNQQNYMDLRNRKRLLGDTSITEADEYLFLECLLSCREKFTIGYTGFDIKENEKLWPNALVHQLIDYLQSHILEESHVPKLNICQQALEEWQLSAECSTFNKLSDFGTAFNSKLNGKTNPLVEFFEKNVELNDKNAGHATRSMAKHLNLNQMMSFLNQPADGLASIHLGLRNSDHHDKASWDQEENSLSYQDEALRLIHLSSMYLKGIQKDGHIVKSHPVNFMETTQHYYQLQSHFSRTPDHQFKKIDYQETLSLAQRLLSEQMLEGLLKARLGWKIYQHFQLGQIHHQESGESQIYPFKVQLQGRPSPEKDLNINIRGTLPWVMLGPNGEFEVIQFSRKEPEPILKSQFLKSILFYICHVASETCDQPSPSGLNVHIISLKNRSLWVYPELTTNEAKAYLQDLLLDIYLKPTFDLLPAHLCLSDEFFPQNFEKESPVQKSYLFKSRLEEMMDLNKPGLNHFSKPLLELDHDAIPDNGLDIIQKRFPHFLFPEKVQIDES